MAKPIVEKLVADPKTDSTDRPASNWPRYLLILAAGMVIAFFATRLAARLQGSSSQNDSAALQNIECNPCSVKVGDPFALVVNLKSPVPAEGPRVVIRLSSSDKKILNLNSTLVVEAGQISATLYATVTRLPNYPNPVKIYASDGHSTQDAEVTVEGQTKPAPGSEHSENSSSGTQPATGGKTHAPVSSPSARPGAPTGQQTPQAKPPLDPGLLARLEDAQGRLSAEKQFWDAQKSGMPAGTSLRPEITSLLVSAASTSQRCTEERQQLDGAALHSCIDELNDRLTQLKIQH